MACVKGATAADLNSAVNDLKLNTCFQDLVDAGYPITAICEHLEGADILSLAQAAGKHNRLLLLQQLQQLDLFLPEDTNDHYEGNYDVTESYRSLAQLLMKLDGLANVTFGPASAYLPGLSFLRLLPSLTSLSLLDENDLRPFFPDACLQTVAQLTGLCELDIGSVYGDSYDYDEPRLDPRRYGVPGASHLRKLVNLELLDMSHNDWGGAAIMEIGALVWLKSLRMAGNRLDEEGAEALANLTNLTLLDCSHNSGRLGGAAGIAHIATLVGLQSLSIESNRLGNAPAALLANLTNLVSLYIGNNKLSASAAVHIGKLTQLTQLSVSLNRLGDEGAEHLTTLTALKVLSITHTGISSTGAASISKLPALTALYISHNSLSTESQRHFAKLTCLTRLEFSYNPMIGGQECMQLSPLLRLRFLMWRHTGWGTEHFQRLQTALPRLRDQDDDWL